MAEVTANAMVMEVPCGKKGKTDISVVVAAVRGMAKSGPIMMRISRLSTLPKVMEKRRLNSLLSPPTLATATAPRIGRPAPVITKPKAAATQEDPACTPV